MSGTFVKAEDRVEGLDSGADAYLTDAVNPSEFLATVRALLRARDAERALRETEQRFAMLVRSVPDYAIYTCDAAGRITSWNEGVERIFGYSRDDFLDRQFGIGYASQAEAASDLEGARRNGHVEFDRWHERGDGSRFYANGSLSSIQNARGEREGFVIVVHDVTDQRHAQEERARLLAGERAARQEAEQANRLKDDYLATHSRVRE